jgi:putative membrane protein
MTHQMPDSWPGPAEMMALLLLLLGVTAYAVGVARLQRRGDGWPRPRIVAALAGFGCLIATLVPPLAIDMTFPAHAVRHLLTAMIAPLALALSAPITLLLRTLGHRPRRILLLLIHSRLAGAVNTAPAVLILNVGGMFAYYLTPLYSTAHQHPWLNSVLHLHMFVAGCLLTWYLVGHDPMPPRASTRTRLLVLFLVGGGHNVLTKLMYAQGLPAGGGSIEQLHSGAQIMFYGGDLVDLVLAGALLSTWYARTGRRLQQDQRRGDRLTGSRAQSEPRSSGVRPGP